MPLKVGGSYLLLVLYNHTFPPSSSSSGILLSEPFLLFDEYFFVAGVNSVLVQQFGSSVIGLGLFAWARIMTLKIIDNDYLLPDPK